MDPMSLRTPRSGHDSSDSALTSTLGTKMKEYHWQLYPRQNQLTTLCDRHVFKSLTHYRFLKLKHDFDLPLAFGTGCTRLPKVILHVSLPSIMVTDNVTSTV